MARYIKCVRDPRPRRRRDVVSLATRHAVERLRQRGLRFRLDGRRVIVKPRSEIEKADLAWLKKHAHEVHQLLLEEQRPN